MARHGVCVLVPADKQIRRFELDHLFESGISLSVMLIRHMPVSLGRRTCPQSARLHMDHTEVEPSTPGHRAQITEHRLGPIRALDQLPEPLLDAVAKLRRRQIEGGLSPSIRLRSRFHQPDGLAASVMTDVHAVVQHRAGGRSLVQLQIGASIFRNVEVVAPPALYVRRCRWCGKKCLASSDSKCISTHTRR